MEFSDFMELVLVVVGIALGACPVCIGYHRHLHKDHGNDLLWLHFLHHSSRSERKWDNYEDGRHLQTYSYKEKDPYAVDPDSYPSYYCSGIDPKVAAAMHEPTPDEEHNNQILASGGWKCACGKVHAAYVSSCSCGRNKHGELPTEPAMASVQTEQTETDNIAAIREYKKLMDEGILTAEEFETKKKQLLGL